MRQAQAESERQRAEQVERMKKVDRDRLELLENLRQKREEEIRSERQEARAAGTLGPQHNSEVRFLHKSFRVTEGLLTVLMKVPSQRLRIRAWCDSLSNASSRTRG